MSSPTEVSESARPWLATAAFLFVCNQVGTVLTAALVTHAPLVLLALSPLGRNFLLVSQTVPIAPFVLVGAARRTLGSLVGYKIGRAYGGRALSAMDSRAPRLGRLARAFEAFFNRADLLTSFLLPRGSALMAGAAGMGQRTYLLASTAGHIFWTVITYKLGDWLSEYIQIALTFIQHNMIKVTVAGLALVLIQALLHQRRTRRGVGLPAQDGE